MSQYKIKFTQLSRYAGKLVSEKEDRTKRFVRDLKPEIRRKIVPFQLQIYSQAVEKALEVEKDMQENQDTRAKELASAKRPRYPYIPRIGTSNFRFGEGTGSSITPTQRTMIGSWPRGIGFSQRSPHASFPRSSFAGSIWCPKCNRNHTGNCLISKQCFA